MILKWLIFGAIVYAVYVLFFKSKSVSSNRDRTSSKSDDSDSEEMVECCECGTFVAAKEAFIKNGRFYCSKECMNKA